MKVCQDTIRVLIVDDQRLVRKTLEIYLDNQAKIEVLDCVASGVDALEQIDKLRPDVAIVDLEMPGMSGITTIEIISERFPETKTIVLSSYGKQEYINQAITAGARGYLIKGATPEEITETIHKVNLGHFQLDSKIFDKSANNNFAPSEEFNSGMNTSMRVEDEEDIPFVPTKVEVVSAADSSKKEQHNSESTSHHQFRNEVLKIRRDLLEILEFKVNLATRQKQEMQTKYQKLQTKFSWLVASQMVLFFIMIGCLSSWAQVQLKIVNLQPNSNTLNSAQVAK